MDYRIWWQDWDRNLDSRLGSCFRPSDRSVLRGVSLDTWVTPHHASDGSRPPPRSSTYSWLDCCRPMMSLGECLSIGLKVSYDTLLLPMMSWLGNLSHLISRSLSLYLVWLDDPLSLSSPFLSWWDLWEWVWDPCRHRHRCRYIKPWRVLGCSQRSAIILDSSHPTSPNST